MHIFDICRSNSVTELWKHFEKKAADTSGSTEVKSNVFTAEEYTDKSPDDQAPPSSNAASTFSPGEYPAPLLTGYEAELASLADRSKTFLPESLQPNPSFDAASDARTVTGENSQPLMEAFEAELATLMNSTEASGTRGQQTEPSPETDQGRDSSSQRIPHPVEILAAQVLTHLANGANMVQSEFAARLPDLQRQLRDAQGQLRDAQRALPENVRMSLQTLLTTIEAQMKVAFSNLPNGGRQFAEDAIHAGRPMAENAADNLRTVASELNDFGRSLFAAFEDEFGRTDSTSGNTRPDAPSSTGGAFPGASNSSPSSSEHISQGAEMRPMDSAKEAPVTSQAPAAMSHTMNAPTVPSDTANLNQDSRAGGHFTHPSRHYGLYMRPPHHSVPPMHPGHWAPPQPSTFWPPVDHLPWNFSPARFPHHPPHPRPPPPPPYPGRWPIPGSFGHLFTTPFNQNNQNKPSPVSTNQAPSRTADMPPESENKTLFIGNVGFNVTEKMIQDVFASKGFIVTVDLPLDTASGKHAGFGYLHFPSKYPAMAAIDALQGARIDGYAVNLEFSENTPINSINATPNLDSSSTSQNASQGVSVPFNCGTLPRRGGSIKRRKSVTFKEPSSSMEEGDSINTSDVPPRVGSPQLIDLSFEDSSSAPRVSLRQAEKDTKREISDGGETFSHFDPEKEMSRFPPVSQLEAQVLAKHNEGRAPDSNPADTHSHQPLKSPLQRAHTASNPHQTRGLRRPEMMTDTGRQFSSELAEPSSLRRSSTMLFPRSGVSDPAPLGDPTTSPLKRRASERNFPQSSAETNTWARLDRRERRRSRPSSEHSIPGSFPAEESIQHAGPASFDYGFESRDVSEIQNCVSSLVDMGYGTAEDGGRSRMAVYAAASNGNLLDAIEMIEEERKVYARHNQI